MKKLLIGLVSLLALTACTPTAQETSQNYYLPEALSDCKAYSLKDSYGGRITVLRCPNSATATTEIQGKTTSQTIIIDGVEYVKAAQEIN